MTTLPQIDYASNDFQTFLDNLLAFLQTELPQDVFNDVGASQLMMFMLRMNAYVSAIQAFKLDIAANENFLVTAEQRRSVIRFANSIGFKLSPATASSVTVTATLPQVSAQDVVIRDGTQFTVGDIVFEIDQKYTLESGSLTINMGANQGETLSQDFLSDGNPDQTFTVTRDSVIKDTVQVFVDDVEWTEVDFIVFAAATDQAYVLSFDENDKVTVRFGDGTFGLVPPNGAEIRVIHRVGGGVAGNVTTGAIDTTIPAYLDDITLTSIAIFNNSPATGGSDPQSIEDAKLSIPSHLKTIDHAVTDDDYDILASTFSDPTAGTVAKANAALRGGELNKIDVFIWTRNPDGTLTGASLALRNSLKAFLVERNVISHDVAVFSGITQDVNIAGDVIFQASKTESEIETALDQAAADFFNSVSLNPGDDIFLSHLYDAFQSVDGVQSLVITAPTGNTSVSDERIAVLGTTTWTLTAAELGT
jgi:uncharacterized phage protein gp47/JayE